MEQTSRAEALLYTERCFVCGTVLLELAWVLKPVGEMGRVEIVVRLGRLLDLPTISVRDEPATRAALADARAGMDIADAFHRALSPGATRLGTPDVGFADTAAERPGLRVELI